MTAVDDLGFVNFIPRVSYRCRIRGLFTARGSPSTCAGLSRSAIDDLVFYPKMTWWRWTMGVHVPRKKPKQSTCLLRTLYKKDWVSHPPRTMAGRPSKTPCGTVRPDRPNDSDAVTIQENSHVTRVCPFLPVTGSKQQSSFLKRRPIIIQKKIHCYR